MMETVDKKARQRQYNKRHADRRRENGDTCHTVWLSAEGTAALAQLTSNGIVPKELAINDAIIEAAKQK